MNDWRDISTLADDVTACFVTNGDWIVSAIVKDGVPGVWVGNNRFAPIRHATQFMSAPKVSR